MVGACRGAGRPFRRDSDVHDARRGGRSQRLAMDGRDHRPGGNPARRSGCHCRRGSRHEIDGTTEVAAIVVLTSGVLAGIGSIAVASGVIAMLVLLLVEKSRLHLMVRRIDDVGLRSGVRFAVLALVVLPLLPEGPF